MIRVIVVGIITVKIITRVTNTAAIALTLAFSSISHGQIFQCKLASGKVVFQDSECRAGQQEKAVTVRELNTFNLPKPEVSKSDASGTVLYSSAGAPRRPQTIKVNEIRVVSESEDSLLMDVSYTYDHPDIPASDIKVFMMPNHRYWSVASVRAEKGFSLARIRIGLSRSNLEEDNKSRSYTSSLEVRFEHYPKKGPYGGVIWRRSVPFEKHWHFPGEK